MKLARVISAVLSYKDFHLCLLFLANCCLYKNFGNMVGELLLWDAVFVVLSQITVQFRSLHPPSELYSPQSTHSSPSVGCAAHDVSTTHITVTTLAVYRPRTCYISLPLVCLSPLIFIHIHLLVYTDFFSSVVAPWFTIIHTLLLTI